MAQNKNHKKLLVVFGALSGWITSLVVLKIGRTLSFVIGSVIICMEFTNEREFLKLNWSKLNDRFVSTPDNFKDLNIWRSTMERYPFMDTAKKSVKENESKLSTFIASFVGGVLLAVGYH